MATSIGRGRPPRARIRLSFNDPVVRAVLWQLVVVGLVAAGLWYLIATTIGNLRTRGIASGFNYLADTSEVPIGETPIFYADGVSTYFRALVIGVINTLRVAVAGIVLATILGTLVGIARLSRNYLIARIASGYVEVMRNIPLLLQLLFWYTLLQALPAVRQSFNPLPGVYLSQRGLYFPWLDWHEGLVWPLGALGAGIVLALVVRSWARARQARTGQQFPVGWTALGLVVGLPLAALIWTYGIERSTIAFRGIELPFVRIAPGLPIDLPVLGTFNLVGGARLTPEFVALLIGLVTYTAAFIAEIVRSGIMAVSKGQTEAAMALGLKRGQALRMVILPQAMRVIIPPMTSQYLNITKNSSLAVAIGYPEIVSVANTILNKNGQAIEGIASIMAVYLTISLSISLFMNWYNRRIALKER